MEVWELKQRQSLPLEAKVKLSLSRIRQFYDYFNGNVYISFSGGKDSTVLLNIVRSLYPKVPAVFVNTGLEYPEIVKFVKTIDDVVWLRPKMNFKDVLEKYGYPVVSKETSQKIYDIRNTKSEKTRNRRLYGDDKGNMGKLSNRWRFLINAPFLISSKCCDVLKKRPSKLYEKETGNKPYLGLMASDSRGRRNVYLQSGCNNFNSNRPVSNPLMVWLEKDIWEYIKKYNIPYSGIYDMGRYRGTGCMFCMFGLHLEKGPNKFQLMEKTHPKLYKYCMKNLGCRKVLDYIGVSTKEEGILFQS